MIALLQLKTEFTSPIMKIPSTPIQSIGHSWLLDIHWRLSKIEASSMWIEDVSASKLQREGGVAIIERISKIENIW